MARPTRSYRPGSAISRGRSSPSVGRKSHRAGGPPGPAEREALYGPGPDGRGDVFYLHILDETMAYEVDQILPMVDKDDTEALTGALAIEEAKRLRDLIYLHPVRGQYAPAPCAGRADRV